jgi:hypothetical protein
MPEIARKVSIDEIVECAAAGVLRALDARSAAGKRSSDTGAADLVRSGFVVDIIIRAGGIPTDPVSKQDLGSIDK